ncbi:hypothetical protein BaRGS_00013857 [Batillaria attramentaria]|uniref:Uncharacterized protein n=1 Tax=Batillaria attramentaria TaxID=370345 RepID=A0ABD0L677_9CAEN
MVPREESQISTEVKHLSTLAVGEGGTPFAWDQEIWKEDGCPFSDVQRAGVNPFSNTTFTVSFMVTATAFMDSHKAKQAPIRIRVLPANGHSPRDRRTDRGTFVIAFPYNVAAKPDLPATQTYPSVRH